MKEGAEEHLKSCDDKKAIAAYKKKVADYVRKYASEEALRNLRDPAEVSSSSESSMSDFSEDEAQVKHK